MAAMECTIHFESKAVAERRGLWKRVFCRYTPWCDCCCASGMPHPDHFVCEVQEIDEQVEMTPEIEALMRQLQTTFESYVKLNRAVQPEMVLAINAIEDADRLADSLVGALKLKLEDSSRS